MTSTEKKDYVLQNIEKFKTSVDKKEGKFRRRFIGHEGISAHIAVDILNKTDISVEDKIKIFKLVAMHGDLFHHIKSDGTIKDDILKVFMGEKELLANLVHQVRADSLGRFYEGDKLSNTLFTHNLPEQFAPVIDKLSNGLDTVVDNDKPELIILVGAPCSEKSSTRNKLLIDNPDLVVISRDDLVESFAKKINLDYSETFKFLMDNKDIEADEITNIIEALKTDIIKNNKSVLIDMTSMSKKSRRKWIHSFPKHNAKCILFNLVFFIFSFFLFFLYFFLFLLYSLFFLFYLLFLFLLLFRIRYF